MEATTPHNVVQVAPEINEDSLKSKLLTLFTEGVSRDSSKIAANVLRKYLYKYYIQSLVYDYYKNCGTDFSTYINNISSEQLKTFSVPYRFISGVLEQITKDADELHIGDRIMPLGDIHYLGGTKYLKDGSVCYSGYPDYDELIRKLIRLIAPEIIISFPEHQKASTIITRKYNSIIDHTKSISDVKEYYYRLGLTIPILLLLRAIDVYSENLLVHLPHPIFFDLECIFTRELRNNNKYSIAHTGLINTRNDYDVSALTGGVEKVYSYLYPKLSGDNHKPKLVWKHKSYLDASNIPYLNTSACDAKQYLGTILEGYNNSQKLINSKLHDIKEITSKTQTFVRYIHRPTSFYASRIQYYLFPNINQSTELNEFMGNELAKHSSIYQIINDDLMMKYESQALSRGLIPVFYSEIHSKEVINSHGQVIGKHSNSPYDVWLTHIAESESFLDEQKAVLKERLTL